VALISHHTRWSIIIHHTILFLKPSSTQHLRLSCLSSSQVSSVWAWNTLHICGKARVRLVKGRLFRARRYLGDNYLTGDYVPSSQSIEHRELAMWLVRMLLYRTISKRSYLVVHSFMSTNLCDGVIVANELLTWHGWRGKLFKENNSEMTNTEPEW
jgi:hypothetical protein